MATIPAPEFHVGDTWPIVLTFYDQNQAVVNLQGNTQLTFTFQYPDGKTNFDKTPSFFTDGSDGKAKYVPSSTDFPKKGVWRIQGYVQFASGQGYSTVAELTVHGTLKNPAT